ncbi:curli production assembly protein CsgF [Alteromonas mediterranea]|jgi:curli production assembly/transport component CsgF|uniref:Curli production assembly/transport component CsgF n=2 Tax=Alteromonas mediterranea TaxID=314275 RepID=F2G3K8_ALTMD|nr:MULTISPECIES: curli assembly protein CsgF [Alteromonas]MBR9785527.1 curli production assembly protein CsgF [Gammaproteobacteria bacterium]MDY6882978.1 curli assembly protein CsgF [Pseudomonadota bacterium]AEA99405.2 curli production assembly protein CsgF [Alteromonas mediterranea DE]APD95186.1 curli production assembly protein CsgF [Alteromonas mediterranea]APD98822.1 curli production assembly protein CsgF [Alteromonas mediterranea]|tara:strand:- start:1629 stop:2084 length:456 start_codon:yes stop_codon:yes gene_type:complete
MVMKKRTLITALITLGAVFQFSAFATELVYEPINPSFGGNPLNGSFLLSKANSQNAHSAPLSERSYDERLQESLERAYINRIVREITDIAFGEQEYDEDGNPIDSIFNQDSIFVSGDFQVELITSNPDSIVVNITNLLTGEVTVVEIPRFG